MTKQNERVLNKLISTIRNLRNEVAPGSKSLRALGIRIGLAVQNHVRAEITRKKVDTKYGTGTLRRKGALINSINFKLHQRGSTMAVVVGSFGVRYAAIHEFGGTIRPVKKKALAIPIGKEFKDRSPSHFNRNKFKLIWPEGSKKGFLIDKKKDELAYILQPEVKIPARPYLHPGFEKAGPTILRAIKNYSRSLRGLPNG